MDKDVQIISLEKQLELFQIEKIHLNNKIEKLYGEIDAKNQVNLIFL